MAKNYRHAEAKKHQEVVTPIELLKEIYKHLKAEDFKDKDILDPCVGPGAMSIPFMKLMAKGGGPKSITVCDIQQEHIDNIQDIWNGMIKDNKNKNKG